MAEVVMRFSASILLWEVVQGPFPNKLTKGNPPPGGGEALKFEMNFQILNPSLVWGFGKVIDERGWLR